MSVSGDLALSSLAGVVLSPEAVKSSISLITWTPGSGVVVLAAEGQNSALAVGALSGFARSAATASSTRRPVLSGGVPRAIVVLV